MQLFLLSTLIFFSNLLSMLLNQWSIYNKIQLGCPLDIFPLYSMRHLGQMVSVVNGLGVFYNVV